MEIALYLKIRRVTGGAERRLGRLFNQLNDNNHKVTLLLLGNDNDISNFLKKELNIVNASIYQTPDITKLCWHIFKKRYDWICFFDSNLYLSFILFTTFFIKSKTLMSVAYYLYAYGHFPNKSQKIRFFFFMKTVTHIDCLYPKGTSKLKKRYNRKNVTTTPIPSTRLELFKPLQKETSIVFASRLVSTKNPELVLLMANNLKNFLRKTNYKIILCGDGPLFNELKEKTIAYGIDDIVDMTGYTDMKNILPKSRIFLSLQNHENYPSQVLLEAIASGNYIVATKFGDTNKIVQPEFGTLINLNQQSLSNAIKKSIQLVENKPDYIVKSARSFAEQHFNQIKSISHIQNIFSKYNIK